MVEGEQRRLLRDHSLRPARRRLGAGQSRLGARWDGPAPIGRQFRWRRNVRTIRGRADNLPSPGIRIGRSGAAGSSLSVVAAYPTRADMAQLLKESKWTSAADLILLDAGRA